MAWDDLTNTLASGTPLAFGIPIALGRSRLNKAQRSYEKGRMVEAYRRAGENHKAFGEHSEINRQKLQQSMAARGLGNSSVATQASDQFERDYQRQEANLAYEENAAAKRLRLYNKQRALKRRLGPIMFIEQLAERMASMMMMTQGMQGGTGGGGEVPLSAPQGSPPSFLSKTMDQTSFDPFGEMPSPFDNPY